MFYGSHFEHKNIESNEVYDANSNQLKRSSIKDSSIDWGYQPSEGKEDIQSTNLLPQVQTIKNTNTHEKSVSSSALSQIHPKRLTKNISAPNLIYDKDLISSTRK